MYKRTVVVDECYHVFSLNFKTISSKVENLYHPGLGDG